MAVFLCAHMVFSVHIYDQISSFYANTSYILSGLTSRPHLTLIASLKALSPNSHILRGWGLKPQHMNGGGVGQTVQPIRAAKRGSTHCQVMLCRTSPTNLFSISLNIFSLYLYIPSPWYGLWPLQGISGSHRKTGEAGKDLLVFV